VGCPRELWEVEWRRRESSGTPVVLPHIFQPAGCFAWRRRRHRLLSLSPPFVLRESIPMTPVPLAKRDTAEVEITKRHGTGTEAADWQGCYTWAGGLIGSTRYGTRENYTLPQIYGIESGRESLAKNTKVSEVIGHGNVCELSKPNDFLSD